MLVVSAFAELGVLFPGEGRLLEDDLLTDCEWPLPKDKMGEDSRDRL